MNNSFASVIIIILLAYAGFCAYLYLAQRSFIYFPVPESRNVQAEDLRLENGDATLQVWQMGPGRQDAIIYFGGNAEEVAMNVPDFARLFPEHAVYLVNYRGYGASSGKPSEAALYDDALRVYEHVSERHDEVSVIGRSLGSGVATWLATNRPTERLVLVTAFDSIARIAQSSFPIFPVSLLLKDRYDSVSRAGRIRAPTLILIAERDEFIPLRSSEALAAAIDPQLVSVRVIEGATHNTISNFPEYVRALGEFF